MADIPGVWSYLYKNDTKPGESFVRAYSAVSAAKNDEAALKQRADELAQRRTEFEGEMALRKADQLQRQKEHQDRIDQDTERRADALATKFGPALVRGPDGQVDVQASAAAVMDRIEQDRKAEALGMQEIILGKQAGPEFDTLKTFPGYVVGQAKALEKKQQQDAIDKRANAANESRINSARIRSGNSGSSIPDEVVVRSGVPGVLSGSGKFTPLTGESLRAHQRANRPQASSNAPPAVIQFQRDASGKLVPVRPSP